MKPAPPRKAVIRIELDKDVATAILKAADRLGMTQLSMTSRLVKWLGRQDAEIQTEILNESAPSRAVASKLLKRWAAPRIKPDDL
jgi:hypothetical protein